MGHLSNVRGIKLFIGVCIALVMLTLGVLSIGVNDIQGQDLPTNQAPMQVDPNNLSEGSISIDVPKSQELIIVETNNPIYQLYIPFEACRIAYCYEISRFFRNLLADEPTLTRAEALQRCLEDEFCGGAIEVVSTTNLFR